jgi:hypothetical protein
MHTHRVLTISSIITLAAQPVCRWMYPETIWTYRKQRDFRASLSLWLSWCHDRTGTLWPRVRFSSVGYLEAPCMGLEWYRIIDELLIGIKIWKKTFVA